MDHLDMVSLKQRILDDMKAAMRSKDAVRLSTIRMLRSVIQRKEMDQRIELDDQAVLDLIEKQIKRSKDSIVQFKRGGREDLVAKEQIDIDVLSEYMPEQLNADELDQLVAQAVVETSAVSIKDIGRVMAWLKPKVQGRADMGQLSQLVKSAIST